MKAKLVVLILLILQSSFVRAQQDSQAFASVDSQGRYVNIIKPVTTNNKEPLPAEGKRELILTNKEVFLSTSILVVLLLVLIVEIWLIHTKKINDDYAVKLIIISLVIMSALLLIMGGYSDTLIAPAFGLFGTIAGYIFGKSNTDASTTNNTHKE